MTGNFALGPSHLSDRDLLERSRVAPVPETDLVVGRTSATHEDERENEQANDGHNLDRREPELCLAVAVPPVSEGNSASCGCYSRPRTPQVDPPDEHQAHGNVRGCVRGIIVPVRNDNGGRDDLRCKVSAVFLVAEGRHTHSEE